MKGHLIILMFHSNDVFTIISSIVSVVDHIVVPRFNMSYVWVVDQILSEGMYFGQFSWVVECAHVNCYSRTWRRWTWSLKLFYEFEVNICPRYN